MRSIVLCDTPRFFTLFFILLVLIFFNYSRGGVIRYRFFKFAKTVLLLRQNGEKEKRII